MGFPDWQKIVQWIGPALQAKELVQLSGAGETIIVDKAAARTYSGVLVLAEVATAPAFLQVSSWVGGNPGDEISRTEVYLTAGQTFLACFPVLAERVLAEIIGGAANDNAVVGAWPTNLPAGCYLVDRNPAIAYDWPTANVLAGGSVSYDLLPFFGDAVLLLDNASAGTFAIEIDQLDDGGATIGRSFYESVAAGVVANPTLWLPPARNRLTLYNQGAAAHVVYLSVVGKYLPVVP